MEYCKIGIVCFICFFYLFISNLNDMSVCKLNNKYCLYMFFYMICLMLDVSWFFCFFLLNRCR